jgi:hypothetical protein
MNGVRVEWNVWSGAAAVLIAAALVALVSVLSGPYSSTDSKIVYTLGAAVLGTSTLVAGRALLKRGSVFLGWTAVLVAVPAFVLLTYAIWEDAVNSSNAETPFWLGALTLITALLAATARLQARAPRVVWLAVAAGIFAGLAAALSFDAAVTHAQFWRVGTTITILWGVATLLYFLVPVLERAITRSNRWLLLAAILLGGALAGLVALSSGEFSPQGYSIFFTLIAAVLALSAMLGGVVTIERRARVLGFSAVALSPIALAMVAHGIWKDSEDRFDLISTGVIVLIGLLVALAARLFTNTRMPLVLAGLSAVVAAAAVLVSIAAIWGDERYYFDQTTTALWIVAVLCCLLVPVFERYLEAAPREAGA